MGIAVLLGAVRARFLFAGMRSAALHPRLHPNLVDMGHTGTVSSGDAARGVFLGFSKPRGVSIKDWSVRQSVFSNRCPSKNLLHSNSHSLIQFFSIPSFQRKSLVAFDPIPSHGPTQVTPCH